MKKTGIPPALKVWLPFIALFVILVLLLPTSPKFGYEYRKGSEWDYETLYAQFDFPILKTEEQIQEERSRSASSVIPYYKYSEDVVNKNLRAAEGLSLGRDAALKPAIVSAIRDIYAQGVVPDEGVKLDKNATDVSEQVLYVQKDKRATKMPVTEVYKQTDAKSKLIAELGRTYKSYNLDSIFKANSIYDLIVPNLIYDRQTTEVVHAESGTFISPTQGFVNAGQLIVSNGEIVTAEVAQMLDSYKVEYEANMGYGTSRAMQWAGNVLLSLVLVLLLYLVIYFTNRKVLNEPNKVWYILLVFLIFTVCAILVGKSQPLYLFLVPFTLPALWHQAFFRNKAVMALYVITLLPLLIFTHYGVVLFVMFLFAGFVAIFAFRYFYRGWKQFITGLIIFLALAVAYFGFRFIDSVSGNVALTLTFLFLGSFLTVLGYQLVFLFENIFDLISNSRLAELGDTSNKLLRELEAKAPGTFQHSLQVMTMADAAARSIGANSLLVRAGALYHDIGKMNNPQCFIENETLLPSEGKNGYHTGLDPRQSARDIIAHVKDGLELADKYKLPQVIKDFIQTHHGTTHTGYFYNKYINDGGDPSETADFYYPGVKPFTKEQVILMLCDSIEAASRTLNASTPEAYSDFVEKMVASKMNAGQFDESSISIREINTVKESLKSYLAQLYHERVVYPKMKGRPAN
ncbi:MAG: HDIG domain-containing protein [Bacteroidales bacterium]|nr:HDIG domain-containing protein [Bacteroidales bacterium]